jgi:hypothetical protein
MWMKALCVCVLVYKDDCVKLKWTVFPQQINLNIQNLFFLSLYSIVFSLSTKFLLHYFSETKSLMIAWIDKLQRTWCLGQIAFLTALLSATYSWHVLIVKITFVLNTLLPLNSKVASTLFLLYWMLTESYLWLWLNKCPGSLNVLYFTYIIFLNIGMEMFCLPSILHFLRPLELSGSK